MPGYARTDRLSEQVKQEVYTIIQNMKDPRIPSMFTITYAQVSPDLRHAKIGVSALTQDEESNLAFVKALKGAGGFIRRELGRRVEFHHIPELAFVLDNSIERSIKIQKTLDSIHQGEESDGDL